MSVVPRRIANDFIGATDPKTEAVAPGILSWVDGSGKRSVGDTPTKEMPLHTAFCKTRSAAGAVVHLYACPSATLSLMVRVDRDNVLPPARPSFDHKTRHGRSAVVLPVGRPRR